MSAHSRGNYEFKGDITAYDERFLVCRDVGHHWLPNPHWNITRKGARVTEYHRTVQCATCAGERTDTYDHDMRIVRRYYHYTDGFVVAKETANITATEARLEQVRRGQVRVRKLKVAG